MWRSIQRRERRLQLALLDLLSELAAAAIAPIGDFVMRRFLRGALPVPRRLREPKLR